jgi:hypothetical protein
MDFWEGITLINKKYYKHYPSYFTTVRSSAEKEAARFGKMGFEVQIVKKQIKGNDKKVRTVYSLYMREGK